MTIETRDGDAIGQLRALWPNQGGVFRVGRGLAVLDPRWAQEVNATNFSDRMMEDRLVDVIRGRSSPGVSWKSLRAAWASRLTKLSEGPRVAELEERMCALAEARLGRELDLAWAIQEIFTQALIPTVLADLSPSGLDALRKDQTYKLERLMRTEQREEGRREKLRSAILQIRAGWAVRRVLRGRAKGRRPRQLDLADPVVDMLPTLGMDRAVFAVTTILTAIAGPPGAVAVCLVLELVRRPEWAERIRAELSAVRRERFHADPVRSAPATHRFVRETLRKWSSPLVLTRVARKPLRIDGETLEPGGLFHLSPYFGHHDPKEWDDPEAFDPDRWLPGADRGPARPCAHAPFGYAPTSCIGAGIGTIELMLLAALFTRRYRVDAVDPESVEILLASVPLPIGFRGTILRSGD
jgi:cytochrome P450